MVCKTSGAQMKVQDPQRGVGACRVKGRKRAKDKQGMNDPIAGRKQKGPINRMLVNTGDESDVGVYRVGRGVS